MLYEVITVEVNPETAKALGLSEGQNAKLTTPKDSVKVKVHLSNGIMPGVVAIPRGLGHTAYDVITSYSIHYTKLYDPAVRCHFGSSQLAGRPLRLCRRGKSGLHGSTVPDNVRRG